MRRVFYLEAAATAEFNADSSPPPPAHDGPPCDAHRCPWWPYSSSRDLKANTALIVVVLFCALICVLALSAVVRHFIRQYCRRRHEWEAEDRKLEMVSGVPATPYSEEMKTNGAETECIICLSEFVVGEHIRFLDKCSHGFHVQCIQKWLVRILRVLLAERSVGRLKSHEVLELEEDSGDSLHQISC